MSKHRMLVAMEHCIEQAAGKEAAPKIMAGSDDITEKTDKKKIAVWVKGAMEKLDALVDEKTRVKALQNCGFDCAEKNKRTIQAAVARRKKFARVEEFLTAEMKKPMKGTKLAIEAGILYQTYTPRTFTHPMRCYCGLLRGLPPNETISITYCNCSRGFVEKFWEAVLQKPVKVDVLHSAVSGALECKFAIHY